MEGKEIGKVTHWYDKINVAVVKLAGALKVGDVIKIHHGEENKEDTVASMQVDHKEVSSGEKGDEVAIKLSVKAKEGTAIYKV